MAALAPKTAGTTPMLDMAYSELRAAAYHLWVAIDTFSYDEFLKAIEPYMSGLPKRTDFSADDAGTLAYKEAYLEAFSPKYKQAINTIYASGTTPFDRALQYMESLKETNPKRAEMVKIVDYLRALGGVATTHARPRRAMSAGDATAAVASPTGLLRRAASAGTLPTPTARGAGTAGTPGAGAASTPGARV